MQVTPHGKNMAELMKGRQIQCDATVSGSRSRDRVR